MTHMTRGTATWHVTRDRWSHHEDHDILEGKNVALKCGLSGTGDWSGTKTTPGFCSNKDSPLSSPAGQSAGGGGGKGWVRSETWESSWQDPKWRGRGWPVFDLCHSGGNNPTLVPGVPAVRVDSLFNSNMWPLIENVRWSLKLFHIFYLGGIQSLILTVLECQFKKIIVPERSLQNFKMKILS